MAEGWFSSVTNFAQAFGRKAKAAYDIGLKENIRLARGELTSDEKFLVQAGISSVEATVFTKHAPLTAEEQWLMRHGATPQQSRDMAKQPIGALEMDLMVKGMKPVDARAAASAPATADDIKAAVVQMVESGQGASVHALSKPIRLIEHLTEYTKHTPMTRAQLHEAYFTLPDGELMSLSAGMASALMPASSNISIAHADAKEVPQASQERGMDTPLLRPVISATMVPSAAADQVQQSSVISSQSSVEAIVSSALNAQIMEMITGNKQSKAQVATLQRALTEKGYDCGKADGLAGAATWQAIARYAQGGHINGVEIGKDQLRTMESALHEIGYKRVKVDGQMDPESLRGLDKFFRLRQSSLGDFKPQDVQHPDVAALAAVQSGVSRKRGLFHAS